MLVKEQELILLEEYFPDKLFVSQIHTLQGNTAENSSSFHFWRRHRIAYKLPGESKC